MRYSIDITGIVLKATALIVVCCVLGSCVFWSGERGAEHVATDRILTTSTIALPSVNAPPITTLRASAIEPTLTPNPFPSPTNATITPTPLTSQTSAAEFTSPSTPTSSPTSIFSGYSWATVSLPEPDFGMPPVGTMLVMQYTEVFSSPAYSETHIPGYGALESAVWEIPSVGAPRKWLDDGRDKVMLQVSPDGTKIAYIVNGKNGEYNSVWVAGIDGSNPQELTPKYPDKGFANYLRLAGWSADSRKIAYAELSNWVLGGDLYVVDVASKQIAKMDIEPIEYVYSPRWVPGSSHMIALYDDDGDLRLLNINTQEIVTEETTSCSIACPERGFLPDGTGKYKVGGDKLTAYTPGGSQMYQVALEGLTNDPDYFMWSPNGKWFVFETEAKDNLSDIYKVNVSEANKTPQLVLKSTEVSRIGFRQRDKGWFSFSFSNIKLFPTWSPDGQWFVVFNSLGKTGAGELYVINVETNERRTVMTINPFEPTLNKDGVKSVVWLK